MSAKVISMVASKVVTRLLARAKYRLRVWLYRSIDFEGRMVHVVNVIV